MQTCYRHPNEETGVSCSSCGNPICTQCMTPTHVGMRCPDCSKQKTKVRTARTLVGGPPRVTQALVAANAFVFVLQILGAGGGVRARAGSVYENGALFGPLVDAGEWWRLLSAGFLHADPLHIIFNMVGVWFLGNLLEPSLGPWRFAALYFASLFAGSFGALLLSPDAVTVGASGAVFGLLGAAFLMMRERGIDPMSSGIGPILLLNILITFTFPGISIGGHLGGLLGGGLCALLISATERQRRTRSLPLAVAGCVAIAVVAVVGGVIAAGTPALYN